MNIADLADLIERGGIFYDVRGKSPAQVYRYVAENMTLPVGYVRSDIEKELLEREKILSTAVGNGIAIPHARSPIMKKAEDQRIVLAFLENPLEMGAPDERSVYALFIILSAKAQFHVQILSNLAKLFHNEDFRKFLETIPQKDALLKRIRSTAG